MKEQDLEELIHDAESLLDSFITDIEQSEYTCPCHTTYDLNGLVDLTEAKAALEKLRKWSPN